MIEAQSLRKEKSRYRTCCRVCHIKFGTAILGVFEGLVCTALLLTVIQQVVWKSGGSHNCLHNILRDCLIFQFSHFNVTLILDYVIIVMLVFTLISICLLFFGIIADTSCLLLPHILMQGLFLLISIGYFGLHALSYFHGDLQVHSKKFSIYDLMERMWLATLLILLSLFQIYLFSVVIRCSMYITGIEDKRRRRASEFEKCSERVRLAKEKGVWRPTGWGQNMKQNTEDREEEPRKSGKHKDVHVQWSVQDSKVVELDETITKAKSEVMASIEQPLIKAEQKIEEVEVRLKRTTQRAQTGSSKKDHSGASSSTQSTSPERTLPPACTPAISRSDRSQSERQKGGRSTDLPMSSQLSHGNLPHHANERRHKRESEPIIMMTRHLGPASSRAPLLKHCSIELDEIPAEYNRRRGSPLKEELIRPPFDNDNGGPTKPTSPNQRSSEIVATEAVVDKAVQLLRTDRGDTTHIKRVSVTSTQI